MPEHYGPYGPDLSTAAAVDAAAEALLAVWDAAREQATSRLSSSQLRALLVVEQCDGVNLRGLAGRLGMILSSASRLCDRLVAAGVLEREPGRADRREIALHLTPAGHALLEQLRAARRARLATVLAAMSPAGRQALLAGLQEFDVATRAGRERGREARSA
ncbi:DNA-binding transcriptional regulator, MarR family [Micromonospora pattaloongensis]|uniref:DNA-binding transcriptional regulator, MarR family n=1 Tax=Micromonospora pattaloongensis TaxID=405436 RepID=A0A1H3FM26_9ACTN|nr:MarR family winged helix-turn-helix transcriptional regulator [Micromonospora pattaloongensis]SDX91857.1 DNA-binding transcriptional regulator, MarR family [Micromonospora pattaloongensis]